MDNAFTETKALQRKGVSLNSRPSGDADHLGNSKIRAAITCTRGTRKHPLGTRTRTRGALCLPLGVKVRATLCLLRSLS